MTVGRLKNVDLNLLLSLHALLEERNVTHAGTRINMSQPAMSGALARLRRHFHDELLVREGRDHELTPLAEKLRPAVAEAVASMERVLGVRGEFDPATTPRTFAICLSDYALTVLAEPLLAVLGEQADVVFEPIPPVGSDLNLQLLRSDLIIAPAGHGVPGRRQPVFTDEFVCVVAADNPRAADGRLSLADLAGMRHAVPRFGPGQEIAPTPADRALAQAGVERRIEVTVQGLLAVPFAVSGTDLCAFVPRRLAARCADVLDLVVVRVPLEPIELIETAHWHPAQADDPALRWLRGSLHEVAVRLES